MKRSSVLLLVVILLFACHRNNSTPDPDGTTNSLSDSELLDLVQKQTFGYFWEAAEPLSGMARERYHEDDPDYDKDIIATGGSGFGLMAMIVAVERGFITRSQALSRWDKILAFLENADRFHGAWPHWLKPDGSVHPFSEKDDGGDIVETAFLAQGLLTLRQYLDPGKAEESVLIDRIQTLWEGIEWSWYTRGQEVLYWHWSPNYDWEMNFPIGGYNEAFIVYILAAASPSHPIENSVYHNGWARNGAIANGVLYYELDTELDHYELDEAPVGPLFWSHYSFLGLCPKGLSDSYADYWKLNQNHARIHYRYCLENPQNNEGYGENMWGLTSSYSLEFYAAHRPGNDPGVISPTAAISSMPYTPNESMNMLQYLYRDHDTLMGNFGPYDAFSFEHDWYVPRYLAIDQGPIPVMIENYRSGLLWDLFMANEDVKRGLGNLGFVSPYLQN